MEPSTRSASVIRALRDDDLEAARALVLSVLGEFGFHDAVGGAEADLREAATRYAPPGGCFWVAEVDGAVVGTVAVRPKEGRTCELKRLYLRADQRGEGLGQRLYDTAERFAREAGYEAIWLDSSRRFGRAHRLYERNGFVLVARIDNDWEDNVYEKRLAP